MSASGPADDGPALPPFFRLTRLEEVASTNDEAKRLAEQGAGEGAVVVARRQSAGRGRRGRVWTSPEGNLYASFLFRPACGPAEAAQLSFVAALAVAEAAEIVAPGISVRLKWPNDVLADGRKLAGILLESAAGTPSRLDWVVAGIGVNVAAPPAGAASLHERGGAALTPAGALEVLAPRLLVWYRRWWAEGFGPVRTAWLARASGLGQEVTVRLPDRTLEGIFADLDGSGALLLQAADGAMCPISAGEVYFFAA